MGMILAEALFGRFDARLALVGRSAFPDPDQWARRVRVHPLPADMRERLQRLAGACRAVRAE